MIAQVQGTGISTEQQKKNWLINWYFENDPTSSIYLATLRNPALVASYQTSPGMLYGTPFAIGMENYFQKIKNHFGLSMFDQLLTEFAQQSNLYVDEIKVDEWHIYGSSRLGVYEANRTISKRVARDLNNDNQITNNEYVIETPEEVLFIYSSYQLERGAKRYELANHLGNVLTVISDKKTANFIGTTFTSFTAERLSATDYSPFGAPLAERTWQGSEYRYGFNSMEKDHEINGTGNAYDFGARICDSRLGRWLSVDALFSKYPENTPYSLNANNPITIIDIGGDSTVYYSAAGVKLFVSHDNLPNAIVIVEDEQLKAWTICYNRHMNCATKDSKIVNEWLRKKGLVILTNPVINFFKKFQKAVPIKEQYYPYYKDKVIITHFLIKGKKVKLFGESQGNLVIEGNKVTVGKNVNATGGVFGSSAPDREPNFCGTIHTHPSPRGVYEAITTKNERVPMNSPQNFSSNDTENNDKVTIAIDEYSFHVSTPKSKPVHFNISEGFKR